MPRLELEAGRGGLEKDRPEVQDDLFQLGGVRLELKMDCPALGMDRPQLDVDRMAPDMGGRGSTRALINPWACERPDGTMATR